MRTFLILLQKEFLQIGRHPFLPRLILIFPIVVMLVMPLIMTMDVRNVHLAWVDHDHSTLSRRMAMDIKASERFTLKATVADYESALRLLEQGEVDVIVQIPPHFEREGGRSPQRIHLTANAVNATKGSIGTEYVKQALTRSLAHRAEEMTACPTAEWVTIEHRYNPTLNYRHYMIPALIIMLFILICGFLPALSIVGEKENGTMEQINVTPLSKLTFTLSKLVPYWVIGIVILTMAMLIARWGYGLSPAGSWGAIYLAALLFIVTISGFSLTIANFSDTMQQTMFVMFFFVMLFILMSGLLTPIRSMPDWAQRITLFLPPRYFVEILRSVYLKGTSITELLGNYLALTAFATLFNSLAALTYQKRT